MSKALHISATEVIHNLKISCQIPDVIEAIAKRNVILDAAAEAGIVVEDEELQQEGDRLRFAKKLVKATETWAWLKKHHLTLDNFEELAFNSVLSQKLAHHLFDSKVEPLFYQNQLDYIAAVTYEVILDDWDLALELFFAVQELEVTFQEIAREYISDPDLRRAGGFKGIQQRTDFRPEVAAAVFAASPPGIIKPVTTPKGIHLIWVEEIIQPKLDEQLHEKIVMELFDIWLQQQTDQMEISTQLDRFADTNIPEKVLNPV
ncbi:parvulin-like peptidyl-prolyl isomerase [Rivularia sp. PCC 7116]|uniref:peptidylprolyl isomerase n=1 Tax=Rivularia sp. PCC 7116 TaxID=373994 RepID=UPI00029F2335|nr:peptidylprolyl isomerase [Rivularia sp. PCC 7116]AFY55909.1 parvulin-like peptidyl-prolyl isomerase [Rivularia sp. PCC 7116]